MLVVRFVVVLVVFVGAIYASAPLTQLVNIARPSAGDQWAYPVVADINGDKFADFVVYSRDNNGNNVLSWFLNRQRYYFYEFVVVNFTSPKFFNHIHVADFDNDGDSDIIYFNGTSFIVMENSGNGFTWIPHTINYNPFTDAGSDFISFGVNDFDSNGYPDIYIMKYTAPHAECLFNSGGFSFTLQTYPPVAPYYDIAYSTSISMPDQGGRYPNVLVTADLNEGVGAIVYTGTGFVFNEIGTRYNAMSASAADFNKDGLLDIVATGNNCWNAALFINNNSTSSWSYNEIGTPGGCAERSTAVAGDIDGDGTPDIVMLHNTNQFVLWYTSVGLSSPNGFASTNGFAKITVGSLYSTNIHNQDIISIDGSGITVWGVCAACGSCYSGYFINSTYGCQDIDECALLPAVCTSGYYCVNTPGSYQCQETCASKIAKATAASSAALAAAQAAAQAAQAAADANAALANCNCTP